MMSVIFTAINFKIASDYRDFDGGGGGVASDYRDFDWGGGGSLGLQRF